MKGPQKLYTIAINVIHTHSSITAIRDIFACANTVKAYRRLLGMMIFGKLIQMYIS